MTHSTFLTIPIDELKPGMMVHKIGQQTGNLTVKSRGRIKHPVVINQLIACGVQTVVIERTKQVTQQTIEALNKRRSTLQDSVKNKSATHIAPLKSASNTHNSVLVPRSTSEEFQYAEHLVIESKELYKIQALRAEKGLSIDISEALALVNEVYDSLLRNPNALLCVSMLRTQGEYFANHATHVAILLCFFAQQLGMSERDCKRLAIVGYIFDIGMAKIPANIVRKLDKLTVDEQAVIQSHVEHSLDLSAGLKLDNEQRLAIEQHHERLDGTGYPYGLEGEEIHKHARMLAIVDCYDAITSNRPFQKAKSPASALKVICNRDFGYDQKLAIKFVRSIGIYPVGSLVALSNKKIALVTELNTEKPLKPKVKILFSTASMQKVEPSLIDLNDEGQDVTILKPVIAEHYGIKQYEIDFS
ncbi:HD-GYP domain-containing protein [Agaribacter flavus]|uniref:HD-GYP domain-containing protein n=1 Tax=Agaribacter flavus TaxID=1902781 RepID=A0ABV7FSH6_9ALTE